MTALVADSARLVLDRGLPGGRGARAGGGSAERPNPLGKSRDHGFREGRRMAQQTLSWASSLPRVAGCRRVPWGRVRVRVQDGNAHLAGVQLCGSVWACPTCAARIRRHRAVEVGSAVANHMEAGGSAWMITLTARHRQGQSLDRMLDAVVEGFRRVLAGRAAVAEKSELHVTGIIRAVEVTYGDNGWHPHVHCVLLLDSEPDAAALARAMARWSRTWRQFLAARGYEPSLGRGVTWVRVDRAEEAGAYLVKTQDGHGLGNELVRGDLKRGRLGSLTPFELLTYAGLTGDADAVLLFREFEQASHGRKALTWTPGLRRRLLGTPRQLTDEEIVEEEVGGVDVAVFTPEHWRSIAQVDGLITEILAAAEGTDTVSAFDAIAALLAPHRITPSRPDGGPPAPPPEPRNSRFVVRDLPCQGSTA